MKHASMSRRKLLGKAAAAGAAAALARHVAPGRAAETGSAAEVLAGVRIDPATVAGKEGFFRVGKCTRGRWWLIRPDGRPFLYKGVCALYMPDVGGTEAAAFRRNWEAANGKDADKFIAHCFALLDGLGFNALGEWATRQFWNRGRPFTVLIHARKDTGNRYTVPPKHVDVFDAGWQRAYDGRCKEVCTLLAGGKDLVGYFTDNEASWGQARRDHVWGDKGDVLDKNVKGKEPLLLQHFLTLDVKRGGHKAAWEFVLKRHGGSVAQLAKDWGAAFDSPGKLAELHRKGMVLDSKAFGADHDAFTAHFAREYFRLTSEAIRRHDPNHMVLGCRHGAPPGGVVLEAYDRRWVDVLSANNYRDYFKERMDEYYRVTKMPILNGEFSWASGYFTRVSSDGSDAALSAAQRVARRAAASLERAFTLPGLVGYTWYKFCTNFTDPQAVTYGLVNPKGEPNQLNQGLLKRINPRLEGIAAGRIEASG